MWVKSTIILCLVLTMTGCSAICRNFSVDCSPTPKCLTIEVIEQALNANLDSNVIVGKILEKGVNFELNDDIRRRLKKAKANKTVLDAIVEANRKKTCGQSNLWF